MNIIKSLKYRLEFLEAGAFAAEASAGGGGDREATNAEILFASNTAASVP